MAKNNVEVVINTPKKGKIDIEAPKKAPKGYIETTKGKYVCKKACFFNDRLYEKGEIYKAEKGELIPYHFTKYIRRDD